MKCELNVVYHFSKTAGLDIMYFRSILIFLEPVCLAVQCHVNYIVVGDLFSASNYCNQIVM